MPSHLDDLLARAALLEREVEAELNRTRDEWHYRVVEGRVHFELDVHLAHKRLRQSIPRFLRESSLLAVLTAPVIYSMVVPIALLDLCPASTVQGKKQRRGFSSFSTFR
jgi:hypothetical protein